MFHKKRYRALSLLLSFTLFIGGVPTTVNAAELFDENDTNVINNVSEIDITQEETEVENNSELEIQTETAIETQPKNETEATIETNPTVETQPILESETIFENESESIFENESEILENESELVFENESASDAESESEPDFDSDIQAAIDAFNKLAAEKPLMALLYRTETYDVRQNPATDKTVATINSGHTLYIKSVDISEDGIWYEATFWLNGTEYNGYVESYYLAYSDEDWINWETEYDMNVIMPYALNGKIDTSDIDAFPVYYRDKLITLKELHPNWIFVPMNTGLDFNTVVANEMGDKSLIQNTTSNAEKGWVGKLHGGSWYYATKDAVSYYLDPLNFLTEGYIFQFEQLTFNGSYHTVSAIQSFLNGTFMKGKLPDDSSKTYAQAFYEIGKSRTLSPIHLASRVYQEQGNGTSPLISGKYNGYQGYYNYFNVGASGKTDKEVIESGLSYAKSKGWNTHYKSLSGGAATIGNGYILKGQDTLYLQKFDIDDNYNPLYTHQYMQNIQAAASESLTTRKMYANAGSLDSAFVFKIPVYTGMQAEKHLQSVTLDKSSLILQTADSLSGNPTDLDVADMLTVRYNPTNMTDEISSVKWSSSDSKVAKITSTSNSETVQVTAVGEGTSTVTVTVTAINSATGESIVKTASCQITVLAPAPAIENCTVTFMNKDNTTVLKTVTVPYEGSVSDENIPKISVSNDELFVGWFTGKGGTGTRFDSATVLSAENTVVYPYCETQGKGFYVLPIGDYTYTGSAIKPEVQVYDSILNADGSHRLITLEKGKDYTVSYKNNKNVNTANSVSPTIVIKGKGNYSGTEYAYFNILPKSLTDSDISADNMTIAYNGKLQKATPVVTRSGKKLSVKKDFTVSYPSVNQNAYTDAGTYPIVINGTGGYSDTRTVYLKITSDVLMSKVSVAKIPNQTYDETLVSNGSGMTPKSLQVTYKNRTLQEGIDYSVRYANHHSVGTATAYITAKNGSGFSGTKAVTYKIVGSPINKALADGIVSKVYTGNEEDVKQENVSLSLDGVTLREGADYTVSYANLTKAGTASIIFKGINGYSGQLKKTYKITQLDLADRAITMTCATQDAADTQIAIKSLSEITSPYMKGSVCPNVQLYLNGTPLVKGKDYTVKYANNKQVTTPDLEEKKLPKITVTGKGSFKGTLTGTWKITDSPFDSKSNKVKVVLKDVVYKNAPNKFKTAITLIDANGAKLSKGKDYDTNVIFSYAKDTVVDTADGSRLNRKAGDAVGDTDIPDAGTEIRVTVIGKGAYAGKDENAVVSNTYRIISADIAKAKVRVNAKAYQNGDPVTLTADDIEITLNGETLNYGEDYTIDTTTYANNLKKGKATVILKGNGKNYGGEKKITFTIGSKALVWWKNLS